MTLNKDASGNNAVKPQSSYSDIPIVTDVQIVGEEEIRLPPATNPNYVHHPTTNSQSAQLSQASQQTRITTTTSTGTAHASTATNSNGAVVTSSGNPSGQPINNIRLFRNLGRNATGLQCPYCQRQTVTHVHDAIGVGTVVAVIVLAILFWPLCWLPLCVPGCKRTTHYCGHAACGRKVGETRVCA